MSDFINESTDKDIGARLKEAREAAGLSQAQAAKLIGLDQAKISLIERGERSVKATELILFSEYYEAGYEWILGDTADCGVPQEWIDMVEGMPDVDRRKLLRTLAMMR